MSVRVLKVPDIGEGIAEVELVAWHVKPGDVIVADQVVAELMTDKATVEVPTAFAGTVVAIGGNVGDKLAVGSELLTLDTGGAGDATTSTPARAAEPAGEAPSGQRSASAASRLTQPGKSPAPPPRETAPAPPRPAQRGEGGGDGRAPDEAFPTPLGKPLASPSVRRHARDLGVDLRNVRGSGPDGRIRHEDVEAFAGGRGSVPEAARYARRTGERAVPVIGLRRQIATRMRDALRIPHFTYVEEIDVTELEALRLRLNDERGAERGRLTLLPFLMRAIVLAMPSFPQMNARFDDENGVVTQFEAVHIGIATQSDAGLMVPVVRHAEARDLWQTAAEIARLAEAARKGKATRQDLTGSTITITSLGPLGGIVTTPVINPPEVAIVGVNRMVERPAFRSGAVVPRKLMNLSSSFDHRVVDGHDAARFVQTLRGYLECPAMLFVD